MPMSRLMAVSASVFTHTLMTSLADCLTSGQMTQVAEHVYYHGSVSELPEEYWTRLTVSTYRSHVEATGDVVLPQLVSLTEAQEKVACLSLRPQLNSNQTNDLWHKVLGYANADRLLGHCASDDPAPIVESLIRHVETNPTASLPPVIPNFAGNMLHSGIAVDSTTLRKLAFKCDVVTLRNAGVIWYSLQKHLEHYRLTAAQLHDVACIAEKVQSQSFLDFRSLATNSECSLNLGQSSDEIRHELFRRNG